MWQPTYAGWVPGQSVSRRRLLGLGLGAGVAVGTTALAGCTPGGSSWPDLPDVGRRESPTCVARSTLPRYARLADLPLVYEVGQRRSEFAIEPGFAGQLEAWVTDLRDLTGWRIDQLWTYGTWTDGGDACDSWHNAGRAFDLSRLRLEGRTFVSARYDLWRDETGADLARAQRAYWALAASLHKHFAYVLTYRYNAQHHNHLHVDNGRSGAEPSSYSSRSQAQVQAVEGILEHVWDGAPLERVLADLQLTDSLTDQPTWSGFLTASIRQGAQPA